MKFQLTIAILALVYFSVGNGRSHYRRSRKRDATWEKHVGDKHYEIYRVDNDDIVEVCTAHNAIIAEPRNETENEVLASMETEFFIGMTYKKDLADPDTHKWYWDSDGTEVRPSQFHWSSSDEEVDHILEDATCAYAVMGSDGTWTIKLCQNTGNKPGKTWYSHTICQRDESVWVHGDHDASHLYKVFYVPDDTEGKDVCMDNYAKKADGSRNNDTVHDLGSSFDGHGVVCEKENELEWTRQDNKLYKGFPVNTNDIAQVCRDHAAIIAEPKDPQENLKIKEAAGEHSFFIGITRDGRTGKDWKYDSNQSPVGYKKFESGTEEEEHEMEEDHQMEEDHDMEDDNEMEEEHNPHKMCAYAIMDAAISSDWHVVEGCQQEHGEEWEYTVCQKVAPVGSQSH